MKKWGALRPLVGICIDGAVVANRLFTFHQGGTIMKSLPIAFCSIVCIAILGCLYFFEIPLPQAVQADESITLSQLDERVTRLEQEFLLLQVQLAGFRSGNTRTTPTPQLQISSDPVATPTFSTEKYLEDQLNIQIEPDDSCSKFKAEEYERLYDYRPSLVQRFGNRVFSPYTGRAYGQLSGVVIDSIVDPREAHVSGMCSRPPAVKIAFGNDVDNLVFASPLVDRRKASFDLADWIPEQNHCWFVAMATYIKQKYGLNMDPDEALVAYQVLSRCETIHIDFPSSQEEESGPAKNSNQE